MNYDSVYYSLYENGDQPMIDGDLDLNEEHGMEEYSFESLDPINIAHPVYFTVYEPITDEMTQYDYLTTPDPLFSKRVITALKDIPLNNNLQFLETVIRDEDKTTESRDYIYAHCIKEIKCMHRTRSEYDYDKSMGIYDQISKLSLDEDVLDKIEETHSLVFRMEEAGDFLLFHQKVVDAILTTEPKGLRAVKVADVNVGTMFDE